MRSVNRSARLALLAVLGLSVVGCESFDLDKLDVFGAGNKKKLPGERRAVFPEGVPGVPQGVPRELYRGQQQQTELAAAPQPAAATSGAAPGSVDAPPRRATPVVPGAPQATPVVPGAPVRSAARPTQIVPGAPTPAASTERRAKAKAKRPAKKKAVVTRREPSSQPAPAQSQGASPRPQSQPAPSQSNASPWPSQPAPEPAARPQPQPSRSVWPEPPPAGTFTR